MDQHESPADPLLRAIGEMREELLGWIDERLALLRQRPPAGEPAPARVPPDREVAEPLRSAPEPVEPPQAPPDDDARARLDHLARQLGERLRHAVSPRSGNEPDGPDGPAEDRTRGR